MVQFGNWHMTKIYLNGFMAMEEKVQPYAKLGIIVHDIYVWT